MLTVWEEDYLNLGLVSGGSVSSGVPLSEWPIRTNMLFKVVETIREKAFIPNLLLATAPCYRPSWSVTTNVLLEEFTQQRSFPTLPKWIISSYTTAKVCVRLNGFPAVFCVLEIWTSLHKSWWHATSLIMSYALLTLICVVTSAFMVCSYFLSAGFLKSVCFIFQFELYESM